MIPAYFKSESFLPPAAPYYHLVAANGVYLVRNTELFSSVTKVDAVPGLAPEEESCTLYFPRVPREITAQLYGLFQAVYDEWEGEAVAFLYYTAESRTFLVDVPPQVLFRHRWVDGWSTEKKVIYGSLPRPEGYVKLGDAHSHANFPAFFSCTDDRDDVEDGLRLVVGDLHRVEPSISVSFVASGTRFALRPEDVLEDFSTPAPPPREWLERVVLQEEGVGVGGEAW